MIKIHPSSIVSSKAEIDEDVEIGPFCVIEDDVKIGKGTRLYNSVSVFNGSRIGEKNIFFPGAVALNFLSEIIILSGNVLL
jgi:UDP-N-acetylglucosamine acyltransferase